MGFGVVGDEGADFAPVGAGFGGGVDGGFFRPRALRIAGVPRGDRVPERVGRILRVHAGHQIKSAGARGHLVNGIFGSDGGDAAEGRCVSLTGHPLIFRGVPVLPLCGIGQIVHRRGARKVGSLVVVAGIFQSVNVVVGAGWHDA